jgi:predicted  nucleic acid-binding Zn-ribbon protein
MTNSEDPKMLRVEEAVAKLSVIANDVAKVLAVVEQRMSQTEKDTYRLERELDKTKEIMNKKVEDLNDGIKNVNTIVSLNNEKMIELNRQISSMCIKLARLEKWSWMAIGGGISIGFVMSVIFKTVSFLH